MEFDLFPEKGRVFGRVVAVGYCPHCGPDMSVTISQPVVSWKDKKQTEPDEFGPLEMECASCGASIVDVEFPLDETKWQLLIESRPRPKAAKIVSFASGWEKSERKAR